MTDPRQRAERRLKEATKEQLEVALNVALDRVDALKEQVERYPATARQLGWLDPAEAVEMRDRVDALEAEVEGALTVAQHERDIAAARLESLMAAEARVDALTEALRGLIEAVQTVRDHPMAEDGYDDLMAPDGALDEAVSVLVAAVVPAEHSSAASPKDTDRG